MALVRFVLSPVRLAWRAGRLSALASRGAARTVGYRRIGVFCLGVGAGLLVAPVTGRELRERIAAALAGGGAPTADQVAERVRHHLRQSPRTWHLPQPTVDTIPAAGGEGWQVVLSGEVTDQAGSRELASAALQVEGVVGVDNRLVVVSPG